MSKQKRPGFESQQLLSVHFPLRMVVKEIYEVKQCSVLNCAMRSSLLMIDLALKSLPPSKQKNGIDENASFATHFQRHD